MSQLTRREEGAAALELLLLTDISLTPNKPTQAPVAATIAAAMLPPPPSASNSAWPLQSRLPAKPRHAFVVGALSKWEKLWKNTGCLSKLETNEGVTNANVWDSNKVPGGGTKLLTSLHSNLIFFQALQIHVSITVRILHTHRKLKLFLAFLLMMVSYALRMQQSWKIFYNTWIKFSRSQEATWDITSDLKCIRSTGCRYHD